ncbi:MAG TPA: hypothetical protein VNF02_00710, partial [Candidatus Limnocylindrales bacterium]|nr:hypothetical protein [Candidatus Limnocylindrales bacterium]
LRLEIPHNPRDSHFPTATTAARLPFRLHLKWRDNPAYGYILEWLDAGFRRQQTHFSQEVAYAERKQH